MSFDRRTDRGQQGAELRGYHPSIGHRGSDSFLVLPLTFFERDTRSPTHDGVFGGANRRHL
jgi:hypothetical protein